ncbi:PIN/TRAM domain-containing protein [Heliorestis acidaminivorans]|uniref:PIN/TRAM domain-containing protein n=1 Tax=Heliorestis acidaminivorans TaxID=553427 RepID=A0A6I0EUM6_9FIRM|nr:PIN/TRAM domain-containing protein [Heliorestis acidaminivorans]KAB2951438.1 PIN/TRAM domain-containing protein [Heliorestis acidaminivorans]
MRNLMRLLIALFTLAAGSSFVYYLIFELNLFNDYMGYLAKHALLAFLTLVFGLAGYLVAPNVMERFMVMTAWMEHKLQHTPIQELIGGAIGLIVGLIIANLLDASVSGLPWFGTYLSVAVSLVLGYVGMRLGVKKREEIQGYINVIPKFGSAKERFQVQQREVAKSNPCYKVLDTSVIIDGRVADICKSGFLDGTLVIPAFVLEELQHIADSSDLLKRNRGRRGLDVLNKIRKELDVTVEIDQRDYDDLSEVDSKLVRLCQELGGQIITNDYNLNKVAELQGVKVLNINELANALKPVVLPGEEMTVQVIKDGKESGQGVAYLDDGTMIVVEGGRRFMGQTISVLVTSVLQTAAGRMIFAKPKVGDGQKSTSAQTTALSEVNAIV